MQNKITDYIQSSIITFKYAYPDNKYLTSMQLLKILQLCAKELQIAIILTSYNNTEILLKYYTTDKSEHILHIDIEYKYLVREYKIKTLKNKITCAEYQKI